ncbi:MAG TPA: amidohydrolase family protein [Myxococcota bacterium]|jgi:imidazolonepropionase-like amidohydrolase
MARPIRSRSALGLLAALLLLASPAHAQDLLIRNARLLDATGAPPHEQVSILIRDGRIAAIGKVADEPNLLTLDVAGASVLPGLIDSHVHLSVVPGSAIREDAPAALREQRLEQLRSYLACGITTVLDAGIEPEIARELKAALAGDASGPTVLFLGSPLWAPEGYGGYGPAVATPEQVRARFDALQSLGAVGVKVMLESGWSPFGSLSMHSPEIRRLIIQEAKLRKLPIYVHASSEPDYEAALDLGAHALMHGLLYRDVKLSRKFIDRMKLSGAFQVSTLSVMDALRIEFEQERLQDPITRIAVPARQLATARDPRSGRIHAESRVATAAGWLPPAARRAAAAYNFSNKAIAEAVASARRALAAESRAGVPIVVGSDSGNGAIVPYLFHGVTTLREIELLGGAGLSPAQALDAATRTPARMLGLSAEIGTVEPGKRADLVIVRGDPLKDLRALRNVVWTVKNGVAHTPAEWMAR